MQEQEAARATDVAIERCEPSDWPAIVLLLRQLWLDQRLDPEAMHQTFEAALKSGHEQYWVAKLRGAVIGFASLTFKRSLWVAGTLAQMNELVVDQAHRGRGIGSQLLRKMEQVSRNEGAARLELDSAFHRQQAHAFYEKNGFACRAYWFSKDLTCGRD